MNNSPVMNILAANSKNGLLNAAKSNKGQGVDLFHTILQNLDSSYNSGKSFGSGNKSSQLLNLLDNTAVQAGNKKVSGRLSDKLNGMDPFISASLKQQLAALFNKQGMSSKEISQALANVNKVSGKSSGKLNGQDLVFPASYQNQLVAFFNEQGIPAQEISQALAASKNDEGNININKLLKNLSNNITNTGSKTSNLSEDAGAAEGIELTNNTILIQTFKEDFSTYLKTQGMGTDIVAGLFKKLEKPEGASLALLNAINSIKSSKETSTENSFITSDQSPRVQSLLLDMGLGAGDVKNITEKSTNSNGTIEIHKLSAELSKVLPTAVKEDDLVKLFTKNDISVSRDFFKSVDEKTDIHNRLSAIENLKNTEDIKQNIVSLLKEKGVSEENINSFIKNFDAEQIKIKTRTLSESGMNVSSNNVINKIAQNERQIISEVLGKDEQETKTGSWISAKQGIASILEEKGAPAKKIDNFMSSVESSIKKLTLNQEDNSVKSNILNEKVFSLPAVTGDKGDAKLSLADLLKMVEQRADSARVLKAAEDAQGQARAKNSVYGEKEGSKVSAKESADMSAMNIASEKSVKNSEAVKQVRSALNLQEPLPKIADRMIFMIRNGEQKSRLKITPPDLGKLDIDITVKNGHIHANLSTENVMVKELLEANLNQLKQQLNNHGLTVDKFEVMVGMDNGEKNSQNAWTEHEKNSSGSGGRSNIGTKNSGSEKIVAAASSLTRPGTGSSQIDVHV